MTTARPADSASASAGGSILKNLEIKSSVNNYTDNYAHSVTPFEVVGASNKAQAHNYFSGNASAKLSGTWKAENINISATNEDAVDTISEAGGVQGVGVNGMNNDITIGNLKIK